MAVPDRFPAKSRQRGVTTLHARYKGTGAAVPTVLTGGRGMVLTRGGVGTLTLTISDKWPVILGAQISVHVNARRFVKVTPLASNAYAIVIADNADAATDLAAADEMQVVVFAADTANP